MKFVCNSAYLIQMIHSSLTAVVVQDDFGFSVLILADLWLPVRCAKEENVLPPFWHIRHRCVCCSEGER